MDWQGLGVQIGVVLTAAGGILGGVWAGVQKVRRDRAETRAAVAEDTRDKTVADSQKLIYDMLNERLKIVEEEQKAMKLYARKLELHISKLEKLMRAAGLDVPELEL